MLSLSVRGKAVREKLSVTIITLNEEYNIRRAIESVRSLADEIIVVDSGSTDRTREIVEELGGRFIVNEWPGHKEQKNIAVEQAENDWILSIDADEWIDEASSKEISRILEDPPSEKTAYQINRKTMFLGRFVSVWSPDWIVRLFKKEHGMFGGTNPHDYVVLNDDVSKISLKNNLYHESYRNLHQFFLRNMSYSAIAASAMRARGRKFSFLKLVFSPQWAFFKKLFIKGAWKDGFRGLVISATTFFYVFARYAILWDLENRERAGHCGALSQEHISRNS